MSDKEEFKLIIADIYAGGGATIDLYYANKYEKVKEVKNFADGSRSIIECSIEEFRPGIYGKQGNEFLIKIGKKLDFVCQCGNTELIEATNILVLYPITGVVDGDVEYGDRRDGNGMNDAIDHYECGNGCLIMEHGDIIHSQESMIKWIEDEQKKKVD